MIEIRKAVNAYLRSLYSNIFYMQAPDTAAYPYIVYTLEVYPDGEGGGIVDLEIDGWNLDLTGDTTVIENLMVLINSIDKETLVTDKLSVTFFNENMIPLLDDSDKAIQRRKYMYTGNLIRKI